MKTISKEQVCFKCKEVKSVNDFYEKGNRFMNCSKCRKARYNRKKSIELLLNKQKQTRQFV
ncbi:hypothetical protein E1I69_11700 [Bacillus timonensis]|uniref:Zinc-binding domain-containing protein n=1 Tax=Bacillus timonensis TaxID=1033734 RepID=A0A4S3PS25_9BACI|nr:hypothetical protein [Bacillus timonensis]THE12358.1 hypothetical protein E1I69_11700 [Bacillus timonensis]